MLLVTGIAVVTGSVILVVAFNQPSNNRTDNIFSFLLSTVESSSSPLGYAEAAILPLDVKENFPLVEMNGDAETNPLQMKIDSDFIDPDEHCEFCYRIEYTPSATGKAGAILKSEKLFNLEDAKRLTFFARTESEDENVQFNAAGKFDGAGKDAGASKIMKFAFTSEKMKLKKDWQNYEIDLSGADLEGIEIGFGFAIEKSDLNASGKPMVIYLKGLTIDDLPAGKSLRALSTNWGT